MSLLSRLFGPSTCHKQLYDCRCGAPMENTIAYTQGQGDRKYRVETWDCTDEECICAAQAYIFTDGSESYGKGPLQGQVKGREL